jgi:acyl-coenzyme A thioesterase PaaI-like protein
VLQEFTSHNLFGRALTHRTTAAKMPRSPPLLHFPPKQSSGANVATKTEIISFFAAQFPQTKCVVEQVGDASATVKHPIGVDELRPGGTVSGPVLMAVADVALYVAILGEIGIVPLAVTTSLTMNFMRRPSPNASIVAVCKLLKIGKSLAVGEVALYSEGDTQVVAHAVGTYSIPPRPVV